MTPFEHSKGTFLSDISDHQSHVASSMVSFSCLVSDAILEGETTEGEDVVGDEEGVADVIEGGDAEDHVVDGTDGREASEVKDGAAQGKVFRYIIDGGDANDDDGPDGGYKQS